MKLYGRIFALILALVLLIAALPVTAHAEDEYPKVERAFFREGSDGSLKAVWNLDYTGVAEDVSIFHTLTFYREAYHNYVSYSPMEIFELQAEGKVNELDLTPYKEWYFGDGESRYWFTITTQWSTVSGSTTHTRTMTFDSAKQWLNESVMPDPVLTAAEPEPFCEDGGVIAINVSWENMQDFCKLQFAFTVNDGETKYFSLYPKNDDMPVNGSQLFVFSPREFDTELHEGDRIHCDVTVYRMVTWGFGFPIGEPYPVEFTVLPVDQNAPKITGANVPILRQDVFYLRIEATWEHMPLENCVLEIGITVNNGDTQYFEVTPAGENAVTDGTGCFELSTNYLKNSLKEGDRVLFELTFIRDSDGLPLCKTYTVDATVKAESVMKYASVVKIAAVYSGTGEWMEYTLTDEEVQLPYEEFYALLETKASEWLVAKGADKEAVGPGSIITNKPEIYGDGEKLDYDNVFEFFVSPDFGLYDTITFKSETVRYYLDRKPAMWGDVNRSGDIDITDVTWIQRNEAQMNTPYTEEDYALGDVDQNGETNIMDATAIQYYLANMKNPYHIGAFKQEA